MIYGFHDTDAGAPETGLPSEAICFNGVWLDKEISGFRTLYVSGREAAEADIAETELSTRDGNYYRGKRYIPRTITVGYQLIAESAEAFRSAYNRLNGILDAEQVRVIFGDETDKYFVGTKTRLSDPESGRNAVTGEIEIYCADPIKYAVEETVVTPNADGEFTVDYDGTYRCYPVFDVSVPGDLGFISFIDGDGHIIQIGNPDEADGETAVGASRVIDDDFTASMPDGWTANTATLETDTKYYVQTGATDQGSDGVYPSDYGTSDTQWHGPSLTKTLDSATANFKLSAEVEQYLEGTETVRTMSELMIMATGTVSGVEKVIASVHAYKRSTGSLTAIAHFYANDKRQKSVDWKAEKGGALGSPGKEISITKEGEYFRFSFPGASTFEVKIAGTSDYAVNKVSIQFGQWKAYQAMPVNRVRHLTFTDLKANVWKDLKNLFGAGDDITCDVGEGEITMNGAAANTLGAIGNEWEEFSLKPGTNTVRCIWSDWATAPTVTMRYRKEYL